MLKTMQEEIRVAHNLNYCFSDKILPLFEILNDKYEKKYEHDPDTGEFLYEIKGKSKRRILSAHTDDDIITLGYINTLVDNKSAFIDYFRFTTKKYGKSIAVEKVALALKMSRDIDLYKSKLRGVSQYKNLIPVVSIKDGFFMSRIELEAFIIELQNSSSCVALRLTEEWINDYKKILTNTLRSNDYLLLDVSEQDPMTKFMELEEIADMDIKAKVILLNSPRKASIKNGDYETSGITKLINNSALEEYSKYSFDGVGDYAGLKDVLPTSGGSNGTGAALALLYNFPENGFYSFLNPDTHQGVYGYHSLIPNILALEDHLNPNRDCPAFERIKNLASRNSPGNWPVWINIILTRNIHQIYVYI